MYISTNIEDFNINNVILTEPMKNTVIDNSNFIRIMYSTNLLTLNGIYIVCNISNIVIDFYFQKYKCSFDVNENNNFISKIDNFESEILNNIYFNNKNKKKVLSEQVRSGNIKLFIEDSNNIECHNIILKVSGIWESENEYGITYKFMLVNRQ